MLPPKALGRVLYIAEPGNYTVDVSFNLSDICIIIFFNELFFRAVHLIHLKLYCILI